MSLGPLGFAITGENLLIVSTTRKTVTSSGSPVALTAAETSSALVVLQALPDNTGNIIIGGPTVSDVLWSATASLKKGIELAPGDVYTQPIRGTSSTFIDAQVSGEGVSFIIYG